MLVFTLETALAPETELPQKASTLETALTSETVVPARRKNLQPRPNDYLLARGASKSSRLRFCNFPGLVVFIGPFCAHSCTTGITTWAEPQCWGKWWCTRASPPGIRPLYTRHSISSAGLAGPRARVRYLYLSCRPRCFCPCVAMYAFSVFFRCLPLAAPYPFILSCLCMLPNLCPKFSSADS